MSEQKIPIPARLYNAAVNGHVAGTEDIIDDDKNKTQQEINTDVDTELENHQQQLDDKYNKSEVYSKSETYNKTELNSMITTPEVEYVNVEATDQTTAITDVLPATGAANTIYKIGSWDGSQYDTSKYSEYTWNGSTYVYLATRDHGVDDEPTDGSTNLVTSGGVKSALKLLEIIDNKVVSPDFSDLSKWDTNRAGAISVSEGIATITYENNIVYLIQLIPYKNGNNVYCSIDVTRTGGNNASFCPSVVFSLYDEARTLIDNVFVQNTNIYRSGYSTVTQRISSDIIIEKETETGKDVKYIGIGINYVGSFFGQDSCSIKNPIVIMSDINDVNPEYVGFSDIKSKESATVKDIKQGFVASYNHGIGVLNFNNIKNIYEKNLSLASQGISALELVNNTVKQVSSSGVKYLNFETAIDDVTSKDKIFVALDVTLSGIDDNVTLIPNAKIISGNHITPTTDKAIVLTKNGKYTIGLYIKLDNIYIAGSGQIVDNTEYNIYPSVNIDGLAINQTELTINDVRIFKNPEWININTPNNIAKWIFDIDSNVDSLIRISYNSVYSQVAESAKNIHGITPILKGKRIVTVGDSITWQETWQPHIVSNFGMEYDSVITKNGIYFVNIQNGNLFDYGLTYDYATSTFVDNNGVRYYLKEFVGSGIPMEFRRCDDNTLYSLPLTPERVNYPKYYVDGNNNKYLPAVLAYGGQGMRVTGDSNFSMYEMSHFVKLYNPDVVIFTGGTNDPVSTYGTADDPICELTLDECQGTISDVTVCSSVKGAIKRIMADCPNALVFLAAPVRSGMIDDSKPARLNLMEQYKKIAYDMGVGFIDWNSNTGITDYNLEQCFKDGIHPNSHGGWLMARKAICDML